MRRWGRCGCDQARPRVRSGGSTGREQHTEPLRVPLLGTAIFGVFFLPSHLLEWGTWAWSPQGSSELGLGDEPWGCRCHRGPHDRVLPADKNTRALFSVQFYLLGGCRDPRQSPSTGNWEGRGVRGPWGREVTGRVFPLGIQFLAASTAPELLQGPERTAWIWWF